MPIISDIRAFEKIYNYKHYFVACIYETHAYGNFLNTHDSSKQYKDFYFELKIKDKIIGEVSIDICNFYYNNYYVRHQTFDFGDCIVNGYADENKNTSFAFDIYNYKTQTVYLLPRNYIGCHCINPINGDLIIMRNNDISILSGYLIGELHYFRRISKIIRLIRLVSTNMKNDLLRSLLKSMVRSMLLNNPLSLNQIDVLIDYGLSKLTLSCNPVTFYYNLVYLSKN